MSAQEKWKSRYDRFKAAKGMGLFGNAEDWRNDMYLIRREAALERKLEAAQRRIEALHAKHEKLLQECERVLPGVEKALDKAQLTIEILSS